MSITDKHIFYVNCGNSSSYMQSLYSNAYNRHIRGIVSIPYYNFYTPQFVPVVGTQNYLNEDPLSIYTQINVPAVRFLFTGNSFSLSSSTDTLTINITKLDYDEVYSIFSDNQLSNNQDTEDQQSQNSDIGSVPGASRTRVTNAPAKKRGPRTEVANVPRESLFGQPLTVNDLNTLQGQLNSPTISIPVPVLDVTSTIYDFQNSQFVKQYVGKYAQELFTNKSQYFVTVDYSFNINLQKQISGYTNYVQIISGQTNTAVWSDQYTINQSFFETPYLIQNGPFSGLSVQGSYFSYFNIPNKPLIYYPNTPLLTGNSLNSFTLDIRLGNIDEDDVVLSQISYDMSDSGFSGATVVNFEMPVSQLSKSIVNNSVVDWPSTTNISKNMYTLQIPINPNSSFIWRVAGGYSLINIFGIKQEVFSFSDTYSAITQPQAFSVLAGVSSPFVTGVTSMFSANIFGIPQTYYSLSGNSIISGGTHSGTSVYSAQTIQLTYPNLSTISTLTDSNGNFIFSGLGAGYPYSLYTTDPADTRLSRAIVSASTYNIDVSGNTVDNLSLTVLNILSGTTNVLGVPTNGVTVTIVNNTVTYSASTVSTPQFGADGTYIFTKLPFGIYSISANHSPYSFSGTINSISANTLSNLALV